MIKFALACADGHEFESWFQNGAAFDEQAEAGLILCPVCQTAKVTKAIMAPAVVATRRRADASPSQTPARADANANVALLDTRDKELREAIEDIRNRIFEQTDDVGQRFYDEALNIHQGLAPERAIHGLASLEEARTLIEEGVAVMPVPPLPGECN